jgi:chromosome segregation ATPase
MQATSATPDETYERFSDNVEIVDTDEHDGDTMLSTDFDAIELTQTSTPNEQQKAQFHNFKKKLSDHKPPPIATATSSDDLREKSDQLKGKLEELETKIASFQRENEKVLRMRQEMDLARIQLDNDREDMLEHIKDERIKVELQLHDERLKLDQERKKIERLTREAKNPSRGSRGNR